MVTWPTRPTKPLYTGDGTAYSAQLDAYVIGYVGESLYDALVDFDDEIQAIAPNVTAAAAGANYQGIYDAGATYQVAESVSYLGVFYLANTVNTGITPVDGANWAAIPGSFATVSQVRSLTGTGSFFGDVINDALDNIAAPSGSANYAPDWDGFFGIEPWTVTANRVLSNPTGGIPNTTRIVRIKGSDATERTVTFGSYYKGDLPDVLVNSSNAVVLIILCLSATEFVVSMIDGPT